MFFALFCHLHGSKLQLWCHFEEFNIFYDTFNIENMYNYIIRLNELRVLKENIYAQNESI